jgi:hypothetical protein
VTATPGAAAQRPPGVSRWVNAHGKISLAGFSYHAGATYAGEAVEVVASGGLVDILHAGVVVATCAQRMRDDKADRAPRAPVTRRARDATAGLTVTRLATARRDQLRRHRPTGRPLLGSPVDRRVDHGRVGAAVSDGKSSGSPDPARPVPRARRVRQPQRPPPPQELRRRHCRLAAGTHLSPGYPNLTEPRGATRGIGLPLTSCLIKLSQASWI